MTSLYLSNFDVEKTRLAVRLAGDRRAPALQLLSWLKALPRMEAHVLDGPHFLLETHAAECAALMSRFLGRVNGA